MPTPQISAAAAAVLSLGALLALSRKLNVRPPALAAAGVIGLALAALTGVLVSRASSLTELVLGVAAACTGGAMAAAAASVLTRRAPRAGGREVEARLMKSAEIRLFRPTEPPTPEPPAGESAGAGKPEAIDPGEVSLEWLADGFLREQERIAREEELRAAERRRLAQEEEARRARLRRILQEETRRRDYELAKGAGSRRKRPRRHLTGVK